MGHHDLRPQHSTIQTGPRRRALFPRKGQGTSRHYQHKLYKWHTWQRVSRPPSPLPLIQFICNVQC